VEWLNEPRRWVAEDGELRITTDPHTDFWRVTHYDFIRDNGHFAYEAVRGDFVAEVVVVGAYRDLYDQAGLMARVDDRNWMKCGVEYVQGVQHASVVVTRDCSDWSVMPLPENPASIWLRVVRRGDHVEVHVSTDGKRYTMLRLAYLAPSDLAMIGPMCCSPDGDGFNVVFEGFRVTAV
jgi:regulation of enolase protein 1 (concanavalin A-like superfamily)